jgi:16S rRNA (cytidine1402-2'-O)-methyltransferase
MSGTLFIVATPIGNLEDITLRALRVLREVAVIAAEDTRRTAQLLARHGIVTPTTSLHEHNERQKSPAIVERLRRGEHVALVSDAGTPTVSDPGVYLVNEAIAAGIRVEPVPGPSAVMAALSASGMGAAGFRFVGFPPSKSNDRKSWLDDLCRAGGTVVFFEAPHRIRRTLEELRASVGEIAVTLGRELTKVHETLVKCQISEAIDRIGEPRGEYTVVAEMGDMTEKIAADTGVDARSRRAALSAVAESYGVQANLLYKLIEQAKKSGD